MTDQVSAWAERVTIPTYPIGAPDKNPMFLEKRVYQGSSGVVYPYPVIESVADAPVDQEWTAIFLENRYLIVMLLPELGGRMQMAQDKTNGYNFIYHNRVIKPALVGLAGPWISGGIEFNWPQHHRPNTYGPVHWSVDEAEDGSKTVWCAEVEIMFNTKATYGFRLHPDRAYLEIDVQLSNRTDVPQTFLWWANPAVHVNDDYQSIFPPDVTAVMDHGKRDVSTFPVATGTYYKIDYAPGTDISRYKNIPVPTSYMAYHSDFDFVGCYDHGAQAGMMHVANHHLVPGKKQWTWGNGDFGKAWDRQLTDEDGPYIELMCGAFTDNQPDFSWLMPGEAKRFTQTFMPYKAIGGAKNASQDAVINLELDETGDCAHIGVYVTRPRTVTVDLLYQDAVVWSRTLALDPATALSDTVTNLAATVHAHAPNLQSSIFNFQSTFTLRVTDDATELIRFSPLPDEDPHIPAPATPAKPPAEIATIEELFLNGLHLEQYRHATFTPEPYYEEALRRDPGDSRCNNALGLLLYRRGKFADAEPYFRRAIARLTLRNPNPYDGEPFYNLGLARMMQGKHDAAFDALYKATWNAAWQNPAFFQLARLAARAGRLDEALALITRALDGNRLHHQARHLRIALLRRLGRDADAAQEIETALELDPLEFGALWERHLSTGDATFAARAGTLLDTYVAIALDYAAAGLWDEAMALLDAAGVRAQEAGVRAQEDGQPPDPMLRYYRGWIQQMAGDDAGAAATFQQAAAQTPTPHFPNRLEAVRALEAAMAVNPEDALAPLLLGTFWYGHRRYDEAIACWARARELDPSVPTVHRNLGLAYVNKRSDLDAGLAAYEEAFALDPADARVFFELDQLRKKCNHPPAARLDALEQHAALVAQRDDLTIETISLLNWRGRHDEAFRRIMARHFHPWEGGEGKVTGQYVLTLVEQAKAHLDASKPHAAIDCLERAQVYPENLGEGKLHGAQENNIFYYLGQAHAALGEMEMARAIWERAATGLSEPSSAMFYNDQPPDMIFYQGLARRALGREDEARIIFNKLIDYGRVHMDDDVQIDYFAVSLPDFLVFDEDLQQRNQTHCHYMIALGHLGLGETDAAGAHFDAILALRADHLGAQIHRGLGD
ncbi:MAG: DUF5107 domain-containing protein [Caldilineaceae bacterium]|nr:DUF5107 domain-containing protein [Caldilineaceae bacterium]